MTALVRVWGEKIDDLRGQEQNVAVYDAVARELAAVGVHNTRKQVHTEIENTTQEFRKWNRAGTGSAGITWPYFWDIKKFLGSLPVNDPTLAQESSCLKETERICRASEPTVLTIY